MNQDVNKIIDSVGGEWAQDMLNAKKKIAVLAEENRLLREENEQLKKKYEEQLKKDNDEPKK